MQSCILRLLRYSSIAPRCTATQAFGRGAPWTRISIFDSARRRRRRQLRTNTRIDSDTDSDTDTDTDHRTRRRTHLDRYSYVPHGAQCQSVHTVPGSCTYSLKMYGTRHKSNPDSDTALHCATLHYITLHYTTPRAERLTIRHNPERPKNSDQTRHSRRWPHTLARLASGSRRETPACSDRRERSLHPARDS